MSPLAVAAVAFVTLVVLCVAVLCALRASRLDRLHIRTDASHAALVAALERRAVLVRAVAATQRDERLRRAAAAAETAPPVEREAAENELGRLLRGPRRHAMPQALVVELDDAEQRVMLARRLYNDAVRDTLALRSRRLVRWLRLAGVTPLPTYFEIADARPGGVPAPGTGADGGRRIA